MWIADAHPATIDFPTLSRHNIKVRRKGEITDFLLPVALSHPPFDSDSASTERPGGFVPPRTCNTFPVNFWFRAQYAIERTPKLLLEGLNWEAVPRKPVRTPIPLTAKAL